ncbi:MAG: HAMP domain-containing protein [Ruminococcaceae bacterium]|nr:HAMP domain-containing protein [Oscillospiraceae bacterium]
MFKSIFLKYITAFMLIIVFSFIVLTSIVTSFVGKYATDDKFSTLRNIAGAMAVYVGADYSAITEGDVNEFQKIVNYLSVDEPEITLFVCDKEGGIVAIGTAGEADPALALKEAPENALLPGEFAVRLERGETLEESGDLEGMLSGYSYSVGVPIQVKEDYMGAVFAVTFHTGIDAILESTIMTLMMSSIWIMLVSLVMVYIISERLTKPLREMNKATKEFAKGNFGRKIEVRGNDEVAELSKSFNSLSESLENLEYMRSSFVSNVSHELRTPMTTIGGFVDSILEGCIPPEEERHYLEIVSSEIKRLSRLVTSLLEISRMESGQKKLDVAAFDVCELARIVLISNEQRLDEKELDVSFECDDDRIEVMADKDAVHQILFNICDNAIKFSNRGGRYEIAIRDAGDKAEISVYNEGIGISEEDLPFVFDRFYKSDKSRGLDKKGVGLGMYIVKTLVAAHGEEISVESEYGKWCRFTFTLKKKVLNEVKNRTEEKKKIWKGGKN